MSALCTAAPMAISAARCASWTHQAAAAQRGSAGREVPVLASGALDTPSGRFHVGLRQFVSLWKRFTGPFMQGKHCPALGSNGRGSVQANLFGFGGKTSTGSTGRQGCAKCRYKGSVECPGCKGSGKNKKNGNMFERYKCFDCQGFGLISCPACSKGKGLTPEQRGER